MCGSQICCKMSSGRCCGWIYEMKVARMQVRRVYTHQRDRIPSTVNVDHRISLGVVMIAPRSGGPLFQP